MRISYVLTEQTSAAWVHNGSLDRVCRHSAGDVAVAAVFGADDAGAGQGALLCHLLPGERAECLPSRRMRCGLRGFSLMHVRLRVACVRDLQIEGLPETPAIDEVLFFSFVRARFLTRVCLRACFRLRRKRWRRCRRSGWAVPCSRAKQAAHAMRRSSKPSRNASLLPKLDRKSTRLNSSH